MRDFDLGQTFKLITIPFRPFQHLIEVEDQIACLRCIRRHLADDGRFILDLFNPSLPIMARDVLKVGSAGQGVMMTCVGLGAVVGSLVLASVAGRGRKGVIFLGANLLFPPMLLMVAIGYVFSYLVPTKQKSVLFARKHQAPFLESLRIVQVDLKPVPMALMDFFASIECMSNRGRFNHDLMGSKPHRCTLDLYASLFRHQINNWIW
jgi:hypothetical protein